MHESVVYTLLLFHKLTKDMVNKELVINVTPELISIALLEDKQLVELNREESKSGFSVGDIYVGKVRKTMSGLNASFVSIGHAKDAFLHYLDLGNHYKSFQKLAVAVEKNKKFAFEELRRTEEIKRDGRINDVLSTGQVVICQVIKEAIHTKGPRVSTEISLTGRHVVLLPFGSKIAISQKIKSNDERKRLKKIVEAVLPHNYGAIIRTAARGKDDTDIQSDILEQVKKWHAVLDRMKTATVPSLLMSEASRTNTILRDLLNDSFSNIYIDDAALYHEVKEYIHRIAPEQSKIVKLYKGSIPIFDSFDITRQIKGLFGKLIPFKRKSYMIVEHTEAMHVIDINSGPRVKNAESQEAIAMEVNLNAITHIARQLRLRDMGGIIVIDFIDVHRSENREMIFHKMKEAMSADRAKHTILPLSKFGLMQITRQRVRPETNIKNLETCPTCRGTGEITPSILFDTQIENEIAFFVKEHHYKYIKIKTHPYVAAYINDGLIPLRWKWALKFGCYVKVVADESIGYVDAKYYNREGDELSSLSIIENELDVDIEDSDKESYIEEI